MPRAGGRPPLVVGVTGGIGAGKSAAVDAFVAEGAAAFSADAAVHALYGQAEVRDAVVERWGERVLAADGTVDRAAVAEIVFGDDHERTWLEGLIHPLVARSWLVWLEGQRELPDPPVLVVAEVPLLFEGGLEDRYDAVVVVTAPLELRLERVGARAEASGAAAERAAAQLPEEEKVARADYVIHNTGSINDLASSVRDIVHDIQRTEYPDDSS